MKTSRLSPQELHGVFSVPPLARAPGARRSLDFTESERLVRHMIEGGITRFVYGGNACLYHVTMAEYEALLEWLRSFEPGLRVIPSAGPSYGRAMDQAPVIRRIGFPCVMMLPCGDPRDAAGLEAGLREFAGAAETRLVLYLKDETNFGADRAAGLDVVGRLVDDGVCVAVKYAVVRPDPREDPYLKALLRRVERARVVSGIGERPAVAHLRKWKLPGFTTGSGCLAPRLTCALYRACAAGKFKEAEALRKEFLALENLRDAWGPARVLHSAAELAGLARTGPLPPYLSPLPDQALHALGPVARALVERDRCQGPPRERR